MLLRANDEIEEFQASALRTLASAHRLRIIHLVGQRPHEVHELAELLGIPQAAASQHLAALRLAGLVESVRDGRTVQYRLADRDILTACSLMRGVLVRRLSRLGDLAAAASVSGDHATRPSAGVVSTAR
jgi:DNA-binding transcriptional ArsR family regulator